jgi:hypothetical protein
VPATALIMAVQCKWFDWWGGWAYGYRPWVDLTPYLVLFMIPVIERVTATVPRRAALAAALSWAIFVQGLGALAYDRSWNKRQLFVARVPHVARPVAMATEEEARRFVERTSGIYIGPTYCDVDLTFCRYRLWSLSDNVIGYHATHFTETRNRRMPQGWSEFLEKQF